MADENVREVVEGIQYQGEDEIISYTLDMAAVGTPSSPTVVVKDGNGTPVTATVMPVNSPTVNGTVITLSPLKLLTSSITYRVEVKCTVGGNTVEHFFRVKGQV